MIISLFPCIKSFYVFLFLYQVIKNIFSLFLEKKKYSEISKKTYIKNFEILKNIIFKIKETINLYFYDINLKIIYSSFQVFKKIRDLDPQKNEFK